MAKRGRRRTSMKNRINGASADTNVGNALPISGPTVERIPATEAAWEAGQLHEARADLCESKQKILELNQLIIKKDQIIIALRQKIQDGDTAAQTKLLEDTNEKNSQLRETYGLVVGRQLKKDPETGDVYWLVTKPEGQ